MYNKQGFQDYMRSVREAAFRHTVEDGAYAGIEGCKRLARECGAAIPDFSDKAKDIWDMISSSYSGICVIAYHLKPPVDARDWISAMHEGVDRALSGRGKHGAFIR